ncbi:hypothetical protein GCM10009560_15070 [Nonomuraea longicatena]|uniref:Uncharacterized protein n=1 Tax=Nonomuraea longicatena TaxID=83682 RepID=A0ABN1NW99_9ACTN
MAAGEAAVEGGDADAGAAGDLLRRRVDALLKEDLAGRDDDLLALAAGVGPQPGCVLGQPVPIGDQVFVPPVGRQRPGVG